MIFSTCRTSNGATSYRGRRRWGLALSALSAAFAPPWRHGRARLLENSSESGGLRKSNLFAGDARLELCASSNPGHVTRGAVGPHVRKIQSALMALEKVAITQEELDATRYGRALRRPYCRTRPSATS